MKGWKKLSLAFLRGAVWGLLLAAPLAAMPTVTATPAADNGFTVLCYHRFVGGEAGRKTISEFHLPAAEFDWQMKYLKDNGIKPISLEELKAYWFEGKALPEKAVLLTYDDGFASIHSKAYPVIQKYAYPGVLFLYTDFVHWGEKKKPLPSGKEPAREGALKVSDIKEMKEYLAVESHTKGHLNLSKEGEKLSLRKYQDLLATELGEPLTRIKDWFRTKATVLAYPYGVFDEEVLKKTKELGYQLALTVNPGPNDRTVPPLKLRRNLVVHPMKRTAFQALFATQVLHLSSLSPGDGDMISNQSPLVSAVVEDEIDPKTIDLSLGVQKLKAQYDPKTRTVSHKMGAPIRRGGHMLILTAKDKKGQKRQYSWYFRIKKAKAQE